MRNDIDNIFAAETHLLMKRLYRFSIILPVMMVMVAESVFAQSIKVRGRVSDVYNVGMPGVSIVVEGTLISAVTDLDGVYEIDAPSDALLVFSCQGYRNHVKKVAGNTKINVVIKEQILSSEPDCSGGSCCPDCGFVRVKIPRIQVSDTEEVSSTGPLSCQSYIK